jgi:hypothetical protein
VSLEDIRRGLLDFRSGFAGRMYLEILVAEGINDSEENLARLGDFCRELRPDRVDVVTMTRPGAWPQARPAHPGTLARFREALGAALAATGNGHGPAALRGRAVPGPGSTPPMDGIMSLVVASLERRPQTVRQLSAALGLAEGDIRRVVQTLVREKKIQAKAALDDVFYLG